MEETGGMTVATAVEQRSFPRVAFRRPVRFKPEEEVLFSSYLAKDISQGGLRFNSGSFIPVGGHIKLQIKLGQEDRILDVLGKVVWARYIPSLDMYQLGAEFEGDASFVQWNIARFVFNAI
jgi:c-di-GMP-binding flagellar brake protein YcgR